MKDTAIVVTTCDRSFGLAKTLDSLSKLEVPILVVDDGRKGHSSVPFYESSKHVSFIRTPHNRGLACALNIGLSYWLADKSIEWISYFQDDVEVDPDVLLVLRDVQHLKDRPLLTGHDAAEHPVKATADGINGVDVLYKESCRATHMHAHRDYWTSVMPIPTRELGAPKPVPGQPRGLGSNVDWWIATWAPSSVKMTHRYVTCVPGLVRTFLWKKEDSCWDNTQKAGEDGPLHRRALKGWRR